MTSLDERLSPIPTQSQVLRHGFDFQPSRWQKVIPPEWGSVLDDLPLSSRGDGYRHVTREDLFTLGRGVRPDDPVRTLVACYAWGVGAQGWVSRYTQTFTKNPADKLRSSLGAAQSVLLDRGPAEALKALSRGGRHHIPYLGPSFFTKFLYAVNPPDDTSARRALIMDKYVAIALNDIDGWGVEEEPNTRSTKDYLRWLAHAHALAAEISASSPEAARADAVEMAYFRHGRRIEQQRR